MLTFEELLPSTSGPIPWSNTAVLTQGYQIKSAESCCTYVGTVAPTTISNGEQYLSYMGFDTTLTTVDGSNFLVTSFDAKSGSALTTADLLLLTGIRADGSQVTAAFNLTHAYQTFSLMGFDDLVSLTFGAPGQGYWAVDNIAVGPSTVPEPAAWALMFAGFGAVGVALRRRKPALA